MLWEQRIQSRWEAGRRDESEKAALVESIPELSLMFKSVLF